MDAPDPIPASDLFGWTAADLPLFLLLPALLIASGFFSGGETSLFSLGGEDRLDLRRDRSAGARAVSALLRDPRALLITVLMGNMTVNVLYFVTCSVLLMHARLGLVAEIMFGVGTLLAIVLLGEVIPKTYARSQTLRFARFAGPLLLVLHKAIAPLRIAIDRVIVAPLGRLTAPSGPPAPLSSEEIEALITLSQREGTIDADEQQTLQEVLRIGDMRVREVMTPRTRMHGIAADDEVAAVAALVRQTRLTRLPVYDDDLDHIVGLLHVKGFLIAGHANPALTAREHMTAACFVPQHATLDQLLELFRRDATAIAIVVDEYGGTAGVVATEDVVEALVGDIVGAADHELPDPRRLAERSWRVSGQISVRSWARTLELPGAADRAATLGGLIMSRLGRIAREGDELQVGAVHLAVQRMDGARVDLVDVTLPGAADAPHAGARAANAESAS